MEKEIEYKTLPKGLMIKRAWWVELKGDEFKITNELERKDLYLLNLDLQTGGKFITSSKKITPGFHEIVQIIEENKEIFCFMVDLDYPENETYPDQNIFKITIKPEAFKFPEFEEKLKRLLGFESDDMT